MAMAMFDNVNSVITDFISKGCPYYMVSGDNMHCLWDNTSITDIHEASEKLRDELTGIRKGNSAIFTIKQYRILPKGGKITKATEPDYLSTYKQSNTDEDRTFVRKSSEPMGEMLQMIMEQNKQLQNEIMALRMAQADDDEEIEEKAESSSTIGAVLGHPAIQQLLINIASNLVANTATQSVNTPNYGRPTAMAGVDLEMESIVEQLSAKGVTANDLQKLADMPVEKISFLLSMLRNQ